MTIDEINALILNDVKEAIQGRLFAKIDPMPIRPELPDPLPEGFDVDTFYSDWFSGLFTVEELDAELLAYKAELIATENERLRRKDLTDRFEGMSDVNLSFRTLHPNVPNRALFLRDLLKGDPIVAEAAISALESKDAELKAVEDANNIINVKKNNGKLVRKICSELLDLIAGNNLEKNLTIDQINQMEIDYVEVFTAIKNFRPDKAVALINALTPDGVLVTNADKIEYLAEFAKYGL